MASVTLPPPLSARYMLCSLATVVMPMRCYTYRAERHDVPLFPSSFSSSLAAPPLSPTLSPPPPRPPPPPPPLRLSRGSVFVAGAILHFQSIWASTACSCVSKGGDGGGGGGGGDGGGRFRPPHSCSASRYAVVPPPWSERGTGGTGEWVSPKVSEHFGAPWYKRSM